MDRDQEGGETCGSEWLLFSNYMAFSDTKSLKQPMQV